MLCLALGLVSLLAASPSLAARLRDGQYKISYSPAPCAIETKHYLDLSGRTEEATFNPIPESQAQIWAVSTPDPAGSSTDRVLESITYPGISLGYPTPTRETRLRGVDENSKDLYRFNLIDAGKDGCYYVFTPTSRDFAANGDTRYEPGNRFAYFRGNITEGQDPYPLPMLPLCFSRVPDVAVSV